MASMGTMTVELTARAKLYTEDGLAQLDDLRVDAERLIAQHVALAEEHDDHYVDFWSEGLEEAASYEADAASLHWTTVELIRELLDELP